MNFFKTAVRNTPILKSIVSAIIKNKNNQEFQGTESYWEQRYKSGGNSGSGSYNRLAEFKAKIINEFIAERNISSAIEFGCGDGNNLSLIKYPKYIGLDISPTAAKICINKFKNDNSKSFYVYNSLSFHDNQQLFRAELTLSLDVIFHLVEDDLYEKYMSDVFQSSRKYVVIYSRDYSETQNIYERSRNFSKWIAENQPSFKQVKKVDNPYQFDPKDPDNTSNAIFIMYEKE